MAAAVGEEVMVRLPHGKLTNRCEDNLPRLGDPFVDLTRERSPAKGFDVTLPIAEARNPEDAEEIEPIREQEPPALASGGEAMLLLPGHHALPESVS
jgi:hypothetical protein